MLSESSGCGVAEVQESVGPQRPSERCSACKKESSLPTQCLQKSTKLVVPPCMESGCLKTLKPRIYVLGFQVFIRHTPTVCLLFSVAGVLIFHIDKQNRNPEWKRKRTCAMPPPGSTPTCASATGASGN